MPPKQYRSITIEKKQGDRMAVGDYVHGSKAASVRGTIICKVGID
jgi:hypothetical protein